MKIINLDFLAEKQTIFNLILAYMFDEIKNADDSRTRQAQISTLTGLHAMNRTLERVRYVDFGTLARHDGLEHLTQLSDAIHIYEEFNDFIKHYYKDYFNIQIIGSTLNKDWENDLKKIGVTYSIIN